MGLVEDIQKRNLELNEIQKEMNEEQLRALKLANDSLGVPTMLDIIDGAILIYNNDLNELKSGRRSLLERTKELHRIVFPDLHTVRQNWDLVEEREA